MTTGDADLYPFPGDISVGASQLTIPKAKGLALAVQNIPFVTLIDCRLNDKRSTIEIVVIEVEVERAQRVKHDIRRREVLAIEFHSADTEPPTILALRRDFPKVPHLSFREKESERSLCLYEIPYSEVKIRWTPFNFIESIRTWLSKTAENTLHVHDQPLEPLLLAESQRIILPSFLRDLMPNSWHLASIQSVPNSRHVTLFAHELGTLEATQKPNALIVSLSGEPHLHGVIERLPPNLKELNELLKSIGINLIEFLRDAIKRSVDTNTFNDSKKTFLVLLVSFPKLREPGGKPEFVERWAFLCTKTVQEVAEAVGILSIKDGVPGYLICPDLTRVGEDVGIVVLHPHFRLTREDASRYSGVASNSEEFIFVGLGALGSQIFLNLVRQGIGLWTLIDADIVLPHNLARHALVDCLGMPKVEAVAQFTQLIIDKADVPRASEVDILTLTSSGDGQLATALTTAKAVVDCSASQAVARHLAIDITSPARRCSLFLSPTGSDLVVLCESIDRRFRLDDLEMQYYRLMLRTPELSAHLSRPENSIRYSGGCRDIASVIPQEFVSLHAAIGSRVFRETVADDNASISIWSLDSHTLEITKHTALVAEPQSLCLGDWTVRYDSSLLDSLGTLRACKLPSETGGILIGSFDTSRKIVYIVDLLGAPADSIERPTFFVRGSKGLRAALDQVTTITGGQLEYVGEWHSHPDGSRCCASSDDRDLLDTLSKIMAYDGLPEVLAIAGELGKLSIYLKDRTELD